MPVYKIKTQSDTSKIAEINNHALVFGEKMYFINSRPVHQCIEIPSNNIAVIIYNNRFKNAVEEIVNNLFDQFGPEYYGMCADTSQVEFTHAENGLLRMWIFETNDLSGPSDLQQGVVRI